MARFEHYNYVGFLQPPNAFQEDLPTTREPGNFLSQDLILRQGGTRDASEPCPENNEQFTRTQY